jgi:hypothetical protein
MATQAQHYADSERLIRNVPETPETAALLALAHAVMSTAPRRARRVPPPPGRHSNGSPAERWLRGDE